MKLALAILFAISLRAEVIQLGTVSLGTGIDIVWPDRSDIISLEITFLKPGAGLTNAVTLVTTNRLLQLADIPAELPDGRTILALRWLCMGGVKSEYRLATMDLYRGLPEPPIVRPTFMSQTNIVFRNNRIVSMPNPELAGLEVNPDLARAVAENFRKPSDPPPPLPPATNGMQRAYQPTEAQKAMLKFFKDGGQKGRVP